MELVCHPSSTQTAVERIAASVRKVGEELRFAYRLEGALSRLRIPASRPAAIKVGLWNHTCFEAFIAIDGEPGYHEFNFAPSGEWAVHEFRGYRDGGPREDEALAPAIERRETPFALEIDARVPLDRLSPSHAKAELRIAIAAVVEASDGSLSYWALRHPAPKPDFHHRDGFVLSPAR